MKKYIIAILLCIVTPLCSQEELPKNEGRSAKSLFPSNDEAAEKLRLQAEQLQAFASRRRQDHHLNQGLQTPTPISKEPKSWQLIEVRDFIKDSLACAGGTYLITKAMQEFGLREKEEISVKKVMLIGIITASAARLPRSIKFFLDFII